MPKTQLDLHVDAADAARTTLTIPSAFEADVAAGNEFKLRGNDDADWPFWKSAFNERRATFSVLVKNPALSATPVAAPKVNAAPTAAPAAAVKVAPTKTSP
jgi:hypothetical protein